MRFRIITGVVILALLLLPGGSVKATQVDRSLIVNKVKINPLVLPLEINGRVLVSLRAVAEALGATVSYNNDNRMVNCYYKDKYIQIPVDSWNVYVEREKIRLNWPAIIQENRVLVPISFFNQVFQVKTYFDGRSGAVIIKS